MWTAGPALQAGFAEKADPYFDNVALLLAGDGPLNSTSFVDSSLHAHPVLAYGDAKLSTAQAVSGSSSLFFNGSNSYLTFPSSRAWDFASDFTVEAWIYLTGYSTNYSGAYQACIAGTYLGTNSPPRGWSFTVTGTASSWTGFNFYTGSNVLSFAAGTLPLNTWHHVALCRIGHRYFMYLNGACVGGMTNTDSVVQSATKQPLYVGKLNDAGYHYYLPGYIDSLRVTNGVARYAPPDPPAALVEATNECVACNFDTDLTDLAGTVTFTPYDNAAVSSTQRRASAGSLVLDGTNDHLFGGASVSGLPQSNEAYTISVWIRPNSLHDGCIVSWGDYGTSSACTGLGIKANGTVLHWWWSNDLTTSASVKSGVWQHLVAAFDGTQRSVWLDGVMIGRDTPVGHNVPSPTAMYVGRVSGTLGEYFNGAIDDLRIVRGQALTPTAFTPSTSFLPVADRFRKRSVAALSPDADSAGAVYDDRGNTWLLGSGATLSTTQSVSGGASLYFDGSANSYAMRVDHPDFDLGDTYAVECWVHPTSLASHFGVVGVGRYESNSTWTGLVFALRWLSTGILRVYFYATTNADEQSIDVSSALTANEWTHVAVVRDGTTGYVFINGAMRAMKTNLSSTASSNQPLYLGYWNNYNGGEKMTGYIDHLRITKGSTRQYLPRASAPGAAFTLDPFTEVLLRFEGNFTDETGLRTWTGSGGIATSVTQARFGTQSCYMDSNSKYLNANTNAGLAFGDEDFTVEFWAYVTSVSETQMWVDFRPVTSNGAYLMVGIYYNSATNYSWAWHTNDTYSGFAYGSVKLNTWQHVAFSRSGGRRYIHVDGVMLSNEADAVRYLCGSGRPTLFSNGWQNGYNGPRGYIDELRISRGVARYAATHFPPGAGRLYSVDPLYKVTPLLVPGNGPASGTTIREEHGLHVAATGNAVTSTTQARFNGSSVYFSGGWADIAHDSLVQGADPFTLEAWIRSETTAAWTRTFETAAYTAAAGQGWNVHFNGNDGSGARRIGWLLSNSGGGGATIYSNAAFPNATWAHFAIIRDGDVGYMYVDGALQNATLDLAGKSFSSNLLRLGADVTNANAFAGYLADVRLTKAVRYTPTPLVPPSPGAQDLAVLNFEGTNGSTTFTDDVGTVLWVAQGGAAISTAQSKFGSSALYLPGTAADYIWTANAGDINILSGGDYCLELWFYKTTSGTAALITKDGSINGVLLRCNEASGIELVYPGLQASAATGGAFTLNAWHHVCAGRQGTQHYIYLDGKGGNVSLANRTTDHNVPVRIGVSNNPPSDVPFTGYIDGVRISRMRMKGPPVMPHPRRYGK